MYCLKKQINLIWEGREFNKAGWINERQGKDERDEFEEEDEVSLVFKNL